MKTLNLASLPEEAWRPIDPINGRISNRVSERELEKIPVWFQIAGEKEVPVKLWDYSPFGLALLYNYTHANPLCIKVGDAVKVKVDLGSRILTADCKVENASIFKNSLRIGLSRQDIQPAENDSARPEELYLGDELDISAETLNPILFGEWAPLRLAGVEQGMRFNFVTEDQALCLFLGQEMEIRLALPTSDDNSYRGKIIFMERQDDDSIRFGLRPEAISSSLANDLAELLTFDADVPPDSLKSLGFPTRFFRNRLAFRFVETMDDYEKVLRLRRNAYVSIGKKSLDTAPEQMSIALDKSSRILCAFHDDVLVASAAITFPESQSVTLRTETAFPGSKFPCPTPKKTEMLEINSLCTHQDYRRGDLLHGVFEHLARIFILSDRDYILNVAETALLPIYLGIGFKALGEKGVFLGREHHLIKISRDVVMTGKGMGVFAWCNLYGDLMEDVLSKNMLEIKGWSRILIRTKLLFKPLAKWLLGAQQEKKFQMFLDETGKADQ